MRHLQDLEKVGWFQNKNLAENKKTAVEKILDIDFFEDELSAATCLPALYIDGISVVKNGAWPCALPGVYGADNDEIKKYSIAAKTQKGFEDYMKNYLSN